jgi:hypothetical protein
MCSELISTRWRGSLMSTLTLFLLLKYPRAIGLWLDYFELVLISVLLSFRKNLLHDLLGTL